MVESTSWSKSSFVAERMTMLEPPTRRASLLTNAIGLAAGGAAGSIVLTSPMTRNPATYDVWGRVHREMPKPTTALQRSGFVQKWTLVPPATMFIEWSNQNTLRVRLHQTLLCTRQA